ncbi:hypothetical protein C7S13_0100 [Burkholderia cepacia]|nr:hypothetical protein [Burkholderia cepacia]
MEAHDRRFSFGVGVAVPPDDAVGPLMHWRIGTGRRRECKAVCQPPKQP